MERVGELKFREEPLCFTGTARSKEAVPTLRVDTVSEDAITIEMFESWEPENKDEAAISAEEVLSEVLAEEAETWGRICVGGAFAAGK